METKKIKLSVAIICKNEGNSIGRCLESVKDADEIIIVDTGSEDNTIEVCKKYTDKIFTDYKWNDNFSEARNYAISKCTGDWILQIDADNRLVEGIPKVREEIERSEKQGFRTIDLNIVLEDGNRFSHTLPYLYKNDKEIYWSGAAHNYLSVTENNLSGLTLSCWYSDAHLKDPDRTFRILKKDVENRPECIREKYYLAREYYNRGDYITAIWWYLEYLNVAYWFAEMADAHLYLAKCYWKLGKGNFARAHCLEAINCDANYTEAIQFMAEMSGPNNRDRWLIFSETADDRFTLFRRDSREWTSKEYNEQFSADSDMSRYQAIQEEIGKIVGEGSVLDIGCGVGELSKYVKNYKGFDFSEVAVTIAKKKGANVWLGDAYDKKNYKEADYYVLTEVLEHLDDKKILGNIPTGQKVIFSVPSFNDPSHIRVFSEGQMRVRYKDLLDIKKVTRFNWKDNKWFLGEPQTKSYILLVESVKK